MKELFSAIQGAASEELKRLLAEDKTNINTTGIPDGADQPITLLSYAASLNSTLTIDCLLDLGSNINAQGPDGRTPLIHALDNNNSDAVNLLLSRNADPLVEDHTGRLPIDCVIPDSDCFWLLKKALDDISLSDLDEDRRARADAQMKKIDKIIGDELICQSLQASDSLMLNKNQQEAILRGMPDQGFFRSGREQIQSFIVRINQLLLSQESIRNFFLTYPRLKSTPGIYLPKKPSPLLVITSPSLDIIINEAQALFLELLKQIKFEQALSTAIFCSHNSARKQLDLSVQIGILAEFLAHLRRDSNLAVALEKTRHKYMKQMESLPAESLVATFLNIHVDCDAARASL